MNHIDISAIEKVKETSKLEYAVYEVLRNAIINVIIEPGTWLREEPLARELGVSRVPVRSAINQLASEGLAVRVPNRGVQVIDLPIDELQDIYEMRICLEGNAMELASAHITPEELAQMEALVEGPIELNDWKSVLDFQEANREFHMIAIKASRRVQLTRVLERLLDLTFSYLYLKVKELHAAPSQKAEKTSNKQSRLELYIDDIREELVENVFEHRELIEALKAHDGARARQVSASHLIKTLDWLRSLSSEQPLNMQ
jgi:DNA-binding GntR family transcriptional regulator